MSNDAVQAVVFGAGLLLFVLIVYSRTLRRRRGGTPGRARRGGVGTAAFGTVYDLLSEDKRRAIEIIVEERAEARDPEDAEGNLPDLARGTRGPESQRP